MAWSGSPIATINKYIRGKVDAATKKCAAYTMLKEKGQIIYGANAAGENTVWNIHYKLPPTVVYDDMQQVQASRLNQLIQASLPWAAYDCSIAIDHFSQLKNQGEAQMTNLMELQVDSTLESMLQRFCRDIYTDGVGQLKVQGYDSWFGYGASLGNGVFAPNDTYGGLSTVLGNYGGTAPTGTWPNGSTLTPEYDFHSPLILSSTSTAFGPTATWEANCVNILRNAKNWSDRNIGSNIMQGEPVETVVMTIDYFGKAQAQAEVKEQFTVNPAQGSTLAKLGFQTLNYHGMELVKEYWCPNASAYGLSWGNLELRSLQDEVFRPKEEDKNWNDKTIRTGCEFYGQLVSKIIRFHFKIAELGS